MTESDMVAMTYVGTRFSIILRVEIKFKIGVTYRD